MTLVYALLFIIPVVLLFLTMVLIGATGAALYRTWKRTYEDAKPMADDIRRKAGRVQQMQGDFIRRGNALSKSLEDVGGRWLFIVESMQETTSSPIIRLASLAGKLSSGSREK